MFSAGLASFRENLKNPPPKGKASGSNPEGRATKPINIQLVSTLSKKTVPVELSVSPQYLLFPNMRYPLCMEATPTRQARDQRRTEGYESIRKATRQTDGSAMRLGAVVGPPGLAAGFMLGVWVSG